ncbi:hypothetical protein [Oryzibacter oryziterrae]|uniref:hypothetical protein n=1 Tax=Oryzibacter oryziterrae TaxID=2766474 RepID=UPI001F208E08|nr:hypothetical protein [Oryzibacter oryziterrae]
MTGKTALERLMALPKRYQSAALAAIARARIACKDRWPDLPTLSRTSKEFEVEMDKLAAMFGHLRVPMGSTNKFYFDALRHGEPMNIYRYDPRLRQFYNFFRAFVAQDEEPLRRDSPPWAAPSPRAKS